MLLLLLLCNLLDFLDTRLSAFMFVLLSGAATYNFFTLHEALVVPAALAGASALLFLVSGANVPKRSNNAVKKNQ